MNTIASIILSFTIGLVAGKFFKKKPLAERLQEILETEINEKFSASKTKLMQTVKLYKNVRGSTYNFYNTVAFAANPDADPNAFQVTTTLTEYFAAVYVDKLDLLMNDRMRGEYVRASVDALGRKIDDVIINALFQPSKAVKTITSPVTYGKLLDVVKFFDDAKVDPKDRYFVCDAKQVAEALRIANMDEQDRKELEAINSAGHGQAMGLNWIMSARLSAHAQDTCVAYAQDTVGLAMGEGEVAFHLDWVAHKAAWLMNTVMSIGAKIIQ